MSALTRLRNRYFLLGDLLLLPLAVFCSFVLRLDELTFTPYGVSCAIMVAAILLTAPLLFYACGIYSRYWRYAMAEEAPLLVGAVVLLVLFVTPLTMIGARLAGIVGQPFPRSIPGILLLLALVVVVTPRLAARLLAGNIRRGAADGEGVLVIGAGDAGAMIVRELRRNPQLGLRVVGFVDDDPAKRGARILGVRVLGDRRALPALATRHAVRRAIIAMPTAPGGVIREIVDVCQRARIQTQTVPGLYELLGGAVTIGQLRDVKIEDLLRREPIRTDLAAVGELLRGRRVLITGAGGSIGGELARQVVQCDPAELILLGHGENSIFEIHAELQRRLARGAAGGPDPGVRLRPIIADVRFPARLRSVFAEYRPEIVFHAAAHKHVPLMEGNPTEAVSNNILGTRNVLAAAAAVDVERFVLVSTDKAVNPSSVMGASKRIAELLVHRAAVETGRDYMVTRFGNVLGSRGSVVLTMQRQIAAGGPVTVTHPEMARFFMTIPEAVQLVLQAATLGQGGEVLVFDMGEPVRIEQLARDLIRLSGAERQGVEIVYSGVRPGEKLYEELFLGGEAYASTRHAQIFIAANAGQLIPADLPVTLAALERAVACDDAAGIAAALRPFLVATPAGTGGAQPGRAIPDAASPAATARSVQASLGTPPTLNPAS